MKKQVAILVGSTLLTVAGFTGTSAFAQKVHAPKQIWQAT